MDKKSRVAIIGSGISGLVCAYFLNKDYTQELPMYNPTIEQSIQDLRKAIQSMSEENKKKSIQYIQNLCKLSKLYVS